MREKLYDLLEAGKISEEEYHQIMNLKFDSKGHPITLTEQDEKFYDTIERLINRLTKV